MVHKIPPGKKRQFSQDIQVNIQRVRQPSDQSFSDGISIEMCACDHNVQSGKRDRIVERITARFPHTEYGCEQLAEFWEQNCDSKHLLRKKEDK